MTTGREAIWLSWKKSFRLSGRLEGWLNMSRRQEEVRSRRRQSVKMGEKFETRSSKFETNPNIEIRIRNFELCSSCGFSFSNCLLNLPPQRLSGVLGWP